MVHHLPNICKNIWSCEIVPHIIIIFQNFWFNQVYIGMIDKFVVYRINTGVKQFQLNSYTVQSLKWLYLNF